MHICIRLTKTELEIVVDALGAMADNEHDKGADEGVGQTQVDGLVIELRDALASRKDEAPEAVLLDCLSFGLIAYAIEVYLGYGDDETRQAQETALQQRLAHLPTLTIA